MKQKKVNIGGVEYTLQKPLPREYIQMRERCKGPAGFSEEKYYTEILQNVVVDPQCSIDDFEDYADLEALMQEAVQFLHGRSTQ